MAADPVSLIQATLAPIFLVSGAAIFLTFTQARLFRVVDRLRALSIDLSAEPEETWRRDILIDHQNHNLRRAVILRNSILFGVLVIAFTVLTTLFILVRGLIPGYPMNVYALVTFSLALASFMVALVLVTADAFVSVSHARNVAHAIEEGLLPHEISRSSEE